MDDEKISVVIPCYNSEKSIGTIVDGIVQVFSRQDKYTYEIILVDDHSKDNTWYVISNIAKNNNNIAAMTLSKNFGQHNAIMAAFNQVAGEYIVGMDDDGEHNPENILQLIEKVREGYDYVCAEYEENRGNFRAVGTRLNNWMASTLIGKPKDITLTSFFVMRRYIVDEIVRYDCAYPYIAGLLLRSTNNLGTVKLVRERRMFGSSGYSIDKLMGLWINGFTAFSVKPLRIAALIGIVVAIASIIGAVILIIQRVFIKEMVSGYASLMVSIALFSGIIMTLLGIIGEYLGRIYICINRAPQFIIKERIDLRGKR